MANKLRIKRRVSGAVGGPSTLENAELAYNEVDDILYYGKGTGGVGGTATTVEAIAGAGAYVNLTGAQTVSGVKTFSASPLVPTAAPGTNNTTAASTAFVTAAVAAGGGGVTDGDKGDITVTMGGSVWTIDNKGAANGIATLDSGGKVPTSQLPALAITDTFVVASQAAMLALTAEVGDVAVRTDTNESYILQASPASTLANWVKLLTPASPVTSVFGRTGAVVAASGDYSVGQVTGAAPLASPAFTGTPTAPTAAAATSTTQLATTAFVTTADNLKANLASPTFTGTPAAPTATAGTNTTQLATTAFVTSAVATAGGAFLSKANNLSDLDNAATARTNLGLGTMATQNANAVAITGGTIDGVTLDGGTF